MSLPVLPACFPKAAIEQQRKEKDTAILPVAVLPEVSGPSPFVLLSTLSLQGVLPLPLAFQACYRLGYSDTIHKLRTALPGLLRYL